jgi:hypothetical protein
MEYVEEREFVLRLELRCSFPEDYDGEEDGYAWVEEFRPSRERFVQAAAAVVARRPGWRVRARNRGSVRATRRSRWCSSGVVAPDPPHRAPEMKNGRSPVGAGRGFCEREVAELSGSSISCSARRTFQRVEDPWALLSDLEPTS